MAFLLALALVLLPLGAAMADTISGFADLTYSSSSTKTRDASGQTTRTDATSYLQRYSILVDKTIFPNLKLNAGGVFEKNLTNSKSTNVEEVTSTNTKFLPYITLTLKNPLYTAGVGYFLNEQQQAASRVSTVTLYNHDYQALFGWRPAGFPTLDLKYDRIISYDNTRTTLDQTKDYLTLISQYINKGLDVRYFGTYLDTKDKLNHVETENITHNARGTYGNTFFNGRLLMSTSYNIINNETTVSTTRTTGGGTFSTQDFPFAGLSLLSDTPTLGALTPNPTLIDADQTVSSGINIGLPPLGGDLRARNIGLDFSTVTEVNNVQVWVTTGVNPLLTADVANSFSWDIYTSPDNLNWALYRTVFPATFGPFLNRFDIDFPNVKTRYLKVVVKPLGAAVPGANKFPDILVTELQAFVKQTVGQTGQASQQKITSTTQMSTSSLRYRIFNIPLLYYDFSYYFLKRSNSNQETTVLSNGLFVSHRFNTVFTGTARLAKEDGIDVNEKRDSWVYNASLMATPLRTLTNTLVFSGREETIGGQPRRINSLFLNNTAQLYRGLDVNLSAGRTSSMETDGTKLDTNTLTVGTTIVPHPTMTWNLFLTYTGTDRSLPGASAVSTQTTRTDVTVAYTPVRSLYVLASYQTIAETGQGLKTLQNYGLTWSPFPDGALQFRFSYNETRRPEEQFSERLISPGVRYKINTRSYLDLSFQTIKTDSASQTVDSKVLTANLKIFL